MPPDQRPESAAASPTPSAPSNSRAVAASVIQRWLESGDFPDRLLATVTENRAFVMEVVYGVARRRRSLDWVAHRAVKRPPPAALQACLYVGAYQLLFMDTVPAHAAVHETVSAARQCGGVKGAGFVNSVLRGFAANAKTLKGELARQPLDVRESFPEALIRRWTATYGAERTELLCRWHNQRPLVSIRVNLQRVGLDALLEQLRAAGVAARPHPFRPQSCLTLPPGSVVTALPGFKEGLFSVQDPATVLAVELMDPQPGERILDACAAPGGKTLQIAELLRGTGELVAMDLHEDRLVTLRENLARLQVAARVEQGDAGAPTVTSVLGATPFDRILVDVPCTNTGVLGRRPDARWRFTQARLSSLCDQQLAILNNLGRCLRPGGVLAYSTCSLETEENQALVEIWCRRQPEFELLKTKLLFPPESQTDGAFVALIQKHQAA